MSVLIYGAYGYTGELVAREAVRRGLNPTLSGRNPRRVQEIAGALGCAGAPVDLTDPRLLARVVEGFEVVLHCAGPFAHTAAPMAAACIATGTHYLDVTGEMSVFEALAATGEAAKEAGVMLLPGAGFDVVPTDCLAAHLKRRLPEANRLELALSMSGGGLSQGTARTMAQNAGEGGAIRENGRIRRVRGAWKTREVDFGRGPRTVVSIPWGDVSTAYHSTGIPDIVCYAEYPAVMRKAMRWLDPVAPVVASRPVQSLLDRLIRARPAGPTDAQRSSAHSYVWGCATAPDGRSVSARQKGPEGYTLTAMAMVDLAVHVLNGEARPGFATPSLFLGPDYVLSLPGVTRTDLS